MSDPRLEDHLVGLELQLVELVENKQRAEIQGRHEDAEALDREIGALQAELASTAETVSQNEEPGDRPRVTAPHAA